MAADAGSGSKSDATPNRVIEGAPGPLFRLTDPDALRGCLDTVLTSHPGTVTALDYAMYQGQPALVILVRQVSGSVVVAVGPDCGIGGANEKAAAAAA
jgi:hypothetical protein